MTVVGMIVVWMTDDVSIATELTEFFYALRLGGAFSFIITLYIQNMEEGVFHSHILKTRCTPDPARMLPVCEGVSD